MKVFRCSRWLIAAFLFALASARGFAVVAVTLTMADLYERSREVVIGEVVSADPAARTVILKSVEHPKGDAMEGAITLVFAQGVELPEARPGGPVILFVGLKGTAVHLADGWLVARNPAAGEATWEVTKNDGPTVDFPGRTATLLRVLQDIRAGKRTLVYEIEHFIFKGGIRQLADIAPRPQSLAVEDVNGDGWKDVLVVGEESSQLFLNHAGDLAETPGEISKARGGWAAAGYIDGDRLPDFLVGDTIWLNGAEGFRAGPKLSPLPGEKIVAAGILDVGGDGRADILLATGDGEIVVFENPGEAGKTWPRRSRRLWTGGEPVLAAAFSNLWSDDGQPHLLVIRAEGPKRYALEPEEGNPPADHVRLAGYPPSWGGRWEILGGTMLDVDGNGLPDFYGSGRHFGAVLNGRGFGTFLSNYSAKRIFGPSGLAWGELTRKTVVGAADLHGDRCDDVLVATEDGRLFEVDNPKVKAYY